MESDWVEYYCRDSQFVRVVEVAQRSGGDVKWKYYRGLGLVLGEKPLDGIGCLEPLITHGEFGLAAAHLSLIAHQSCEVSLNAFSGKHYSTVQQAIWVFSTAIYNKAVIEIICCFAFAK